MLSVIFVLCYDLFVGEGGEVIRWLLEGFLFEGVGGCYNKGKEILFVLNFGYLIINFVMLVNDL